MPRFRSIVFLAVIITAIVGVSLTALYLLFANNYSEFINWFLLRIHKPHLLKSASSFLSPQQFVLLRIVAIALSVSVLFLLFFLYRKRKIILEQLTLFFDKSESVITNFFKQLLPTNRFHRIIFYFLIAFYLVRTTFCIFYYPIDFDEADTYMLFSSQGPLVSATFYPLPNNHILFSIITSITSMLPIDPVYALRMPLLPIGLLAVIALFGLLKKYFSHAAALIGLSFFIATYPVFIFSFLARGYLLLLLFFIMALYAIFELCFADQYKKRHSYLFVLASIGGLYTIPSFLYALAGVFLFAFITLLVHKKNASIVRLVKDGFMIAIVSAILYLPVLISVKWSLLKPYMTPVYDRSNTLSAFKTTFGYLSRTFLSPDDFLALCLGVFFIMGSIFLLHSKKSFNNAVGGFAIMQFLLCVLVFFILRQKFPPKPWMHFTVVAAVLTAAISNLVVRKAFVRPYVLWVAIILLLSSGTFASFRYKSENTVTGYNTMAKRCEQLLLDKKVKEVYTGIPYYKTMVDYYAIKNKLKISISNSRKASNRYAPFDSLKKYDLIIIPLQKPTLLPLRYTYDTVFKDNNTAVLLIRQ
jgi:hypothetical protein